MNHLERVLLVLLATLAGVLFVGWVGTVHPLFETVTNVQAQLVPVALVPVVGFLVLRRWRVAAAATLVFVITTVPVIPYWTATADALPPDRDTIRVMQFNVFFDNTEDARIAAHIAAAEADVVVLHEPTPEQWDRLRPLLDEHPHHIARPLAEDQGQLGGGMVMLSMTPLTPMAIDARYSPPDRVTIVANTEVNGQNITIVGLHPYASRTDGRKASLREAQLQGVAEIANAADGPMVVVADLNIAPTSPQYQDFVTDLGWRDPHRVVGWKSTWPSWGGSFGLAIDHVFVSNHFDLHNYEIGDGAGSDHLSVVAEVSLRDSDANQE